MGYSLIRHLFIVLIFSVAALACDGPTTPALNNEYDPDFDDGFPKPTAPSGLAVTTMGQQTLRLNWTDHSSFEEEYRIDRNHVALAGFRPGLGVAAFSLEADAVSFTDDVPSFTRAYDYVVRGATAVREGDSTQVTAGYGLDRMVTPTNSEFAFAAAALSPDGTVLAGVETGFQGRIFFLTTDGDTLADALQPNARDTIRRLRFSPDGTYLGVVMEEQVRFLNLTSGQWDFSLPGDEITFSPDGQHVAIQNRVGIRIHRVQDRQLLHALEGSRSISPFTFSRDGQFLVEGQGRDGAVFYSVATGQKVKTLPVEMERGFLLFSPDGTMLATGHLGDLKVYKVDDGSELFDPPRRVWTIAFSPYENVAAVLTEDDDRKPVIHLMNTQTWEVISEWGSGLGYGALAWTANGHLLARGKHHFDVWSFEPAWKAVTRVPVEIQRF